MTDKEKLVILLTELGIGFELMSDHYLCDNETGVWFGAGHNKVEGYSGFYTEFVFDEGGTFKKAGVYE
jgi:hypothetical protein